MQLSATTRNVRRIHGSSVWRSNVNRVMTSVSAGIIPVNQPGPAQTRRTAPCWHSRGARSIVNDYDTRMACVVMSALPPLPYPPSPSSFLKPRRRQGAHEERGVFLPPARGEKQAPQRKEQRPPPPPPGRRTGKPHKEPRDALARPTAAGVIFAIARLVEPQRNDHSSSGKNSTGPA